MVDTYKTPDSALSETSTNPVQNKVITTELNKKATKTEVSALETKVTENKTATDAALSGLSTKVDEEVEGLQTQLDSNGVLIEDLQENKADVSGYYPQLSVGQADNLPDRGDVVEGLLGFRESAGAGNSIEDGTANVQELLGESLVWNQRIDASHLVKNMLEGNTVTQLGNGYVRAEVAQGVVAGGVTISKTWTGIVVGHKYAAQVDLITSAGLTLYVLGFRKNNIAESTKFLVEATDSTIFLVAPNAVVAEQAISFDARLLLTDLTQMFGAGNEPTTVEEFEAIKNQLVGVDFTAYNAGEVLGVNIKGIKSVNDNAWDEEWKIGYINNDGAVANGEVVISKNYIRVLPSTEYTINKTTELGNSNLYCYDHNKNYIGLTENIELGDAYRVVKTLPNTCYVMFRMTKAYGTTYNHDICIRLAHSGYKTDYVAHEESESSFDLTPYFPDGMHGINGVRDSVTKSKATRRFGMVDLGTLNWTYTPASDSYLYGYLTAVVPDRAYGYNNFLCERYSHSTASATINNNIYGHASNSRIYIIDSAYTDVASFKAAVQGVMLIYELATPIETEIDPQLNMNYKVWDFGTEELLTDSKSAPVLARTIYGFNATDTIRGNKTKIEEQDARIDALENEVVRVGDYQPDLSVGVADNLAGTDYTESEIGFRRSGGGAILDGAARVSSVKGNSVVWNQVRGVANKTMVDTKAGVSFEVTLGSALIKIGGTFDGSDGDRNVYNQSHFPKVYSVVGHKYLCSIIGNKNTTMTIFGHGDSSIFDVKSNIIVTCTTAGNIYIVPQISDDVVAGTVIDETIMFLCTDLTLMFGAGNEPTTIEEFEARKPKVADENAYNEGEVIHMEADAIKSVGVNQWDEEWEVGGLDTTTGENIDYNGRIRSKNFIKVLGGQEYYFSSPSQLAVRCYDINKNFLGQSLFPFNGTAVIPSNCAYIRFNVDYSTTYNNDICINLSDTEVNGKYFPYINREQSLEMLKKYFPQGMKSAGTAHDEIRWNAQKQKWEAIKRIGEVKMKDLSWAANVTAVDGVKRFFATLQGVSYPNADKIANILTNKYVSSPYIDVYMAVSDKLVSLANSNNTIQILDKSYTDAASFIASLTDNDILYYELAEPIVTEIDENFNLDYEVWNAGTEQMIADTPSTPVKASIAYGFNAVGKIRQLEEIIAQLQTAIANLSNS